MPVKLFVSRDSGGRQWAPDHAHEAQATQEIAQRLWGKLHHVDTLFLMLANLHEPSADLVIFTERGLGVIELKHHSGQITLDRDGTWCADRRPITSGIRDNPHQQVQAYAEALRLKTLPYLLPKDLRRDASRWDDFKCQTAVCFTNPAAHIQELRETLSHGSGVRCKQWERDFSLLTPEEVPSWVLAIRHGIDQGKTKKFEPYRLDPNTILNLVGVVLNATEWTEILDLMPDGEPWGYLLASGNDRPTPIGLIRDTISIGRDPENTVVVPELGSVSRKHAQITRELNRVNLQDLSKNGTYVNGAKIVRTGRLQHNDIILLGDPHAIGRNYQLQFKLRSKEDLTMKATGSE